MILKPEWLSIALEARKQIVTEIVPHPKRSKQRETVIARSHQRARKAGYRGSVYQWDWLITNGRR
ncbi:MAG: hypothetical protein ABJC04_06960 [Verrucomicrobiota bacterium]